MLLQASVERPETKNEPSIDLLAIGGANMDISGFPEREPRAGDSSPGRIHFAPGGVARNVARCAALLGLRSALVAAVGDDHFGRTIIEDARAGGVDARGFLVCPGHGTPAYLSLLDARGEMLGAVSQMDAVGEISPDFLREKAALIDGARVVVLDANLSAEALEYVVGAHPQARFVLDPVSAAKSVKAAGIIRRLCAIKPNRAEAEALAGVRISGPDDARRAIDFLLKKGAARVFLSMGREGLFFGDGKVEGFLPPLKAQTVNASGAGDAFVAAAALGIVRGMGIEETARLASAAAAIATLGRDAVNPELSFESAERLAREENFAQ